MVEKLFENEDIVFSDVLGLEEDKIYLRREGEPQIYKKYIDGSYIAQEIFTLCIRSRSDGREKLAAVTERLFASPLSEGVLSLEILKSPHLTGNSAATSRFETEIKLLMHKDN